MTSQICEANLVIVSSAAIGKRMRRHKEWRLRLRARPLGRHQDLAIHFVSTSAEKWRIHHVCLPAWCDCELAALLWVLSTAFRWPIWAANLSSNWLANAAAPDSSKLRIDRLQFTKAPEAHASS